MRDGCGSTCSLRGTEDPFISVTIFTLSFNCLSPDWGQASAPTHWCVHSAPFLDFSRQSAVSAARKKPRY